MFKMMRNRKGFTLIELMIVVVILGILAGLAVSEFGGQSEKAQIARVKADLRTIEAAVSLYNIENSSEFTGEVDSSCALISGNYLKKVPKSPVSGSEYYVTTGGVVKSSADSSTGADVIGAFTCSSSNL